MNTNNCILGIDPGTNILGFAIISIADKKVRIQHMGVLRLSSKKNHQEKLKTIFLKIQALIEDFHPQEMAIEAPFFAKNVQSMLKLGRAQGVAIAAAMTKGVPITEYSPKKIKQAVTGNGNAAKEQVAAMLSHILEEPIPTDNLDATDALATALCHHFRSAQAIPGKKHYSGWDAYVKDNPNKLKKM